MSIHLAWFSGTQEHVRLGSLLQTAGRKVENGGAHRGRFGLVPHYRPFLATGDEGLPTKHRRKARKKLAL